MDKKYDSIKQSLQDDHGFYFDDFWAKILDKKFVNDTFLNSINMILKVMLFKSYGFFDKLDIYNILGFVIFSVYQLQGQKINGNNLKKQKQSTSTNEKQNKSDCYYYIQLGIANKYCMRWKACVDDLKKVFGFKSSQKFIGLYENSSNGWIDNGWDGVLNEKPGLEKEEFYLQILQAQSTLSEFIKYQYLDEKDSGELTSISKCRFEFLDCQFLDNTLEEYQKICQDFWVKKSLVKAHYVKNLLGRKILKSDQNSSSKKVYLQEILKIYKQMTDKLNYISKGGLYEFRDELLQIFKKQLLKQTDKIWQEILLKVNMNKEWIEEFRKDRNYLISCFPNFVINDSNNEIEGLKDKESCLALEWILQQMEDNKTNTVRSTGNDIFEYEFEFCQKIYMSDKYGIGGGVGKESNGSKSSSGEDAVSRIIKEELSKINQLVKDSLISK